MTDPPPAAPRSPGRTRAGIALAFAVGAGLCGLGIARSAAALHEMRGEAVLEGLRGPQALGSAIGDFEAADRWWPRAENSLDIAILLLAEGERGGDASAAAAAGFVRRSLMQRPGDAAAWAWLADAELRAGGYSEGMAAALMMSIARARFEPGLLPWRARMGLAVAPQLSPARWLMVADQLRLLGRHSLASLVAVARATGRPALVAMALGDDPSTLRAYLGAVSRGK